MREVFRSRPQDLAVAVLREKEWWEDEEDVHPAAASTWSVPGVLVPPGGDREQ